MENVPESKTKKQRYDDLIDKGKFTANYVNEFSVLYFEKQELLVENDGLKKVIDDQKQTITKLNSHTKNDAEIQTGE